MMAVLMAAWKVLMKAAALVASKDKKKVEKWVGETAEMKAETKADAMAAETGD